MLSIDNLSSFIQNCVPVLCISFLVSSCSLFTEDLPECLEKSRKGGPDILYCNQPVYFSNPDWHPNGEWIAAEHSDSVDTDNDGVNDLLFRGIWLVHAETGETQPLLPFGAYPDWSPDGNTLAVQNEGITTVQITTLKPAKYDSTSVTRLFRLGGFPTWSGDGEWIAFDSKYNHEDGRYLIWKIRRDSTKLTKISVREYGGARRADWSLSNEKIAFRSYSNNSEGPEIFVMDADGSNPKQLTNNGDNYEPTFSPDGSKIAFTHRKSLKGHIVVMKANGANKKRISLDWSSNPAWSPDGNKIVYTMTNHYDDRAGNGQLWIMNANGSGNRQLTNYKQAIP